MLKWKSLVMALCFLGVLGLVATPAFAVIIDVSYYWYTTGGTKAVGDETWTFGDISGTALVKVEERYDSALDQFQYTLSNLRSDHTTYVITKWELHNPYLVVASSLIGGPIGTSWGVATAPDKWTWSTPVWGEGADGAGDVDNFKVYATSVPPIYTRGTVTGTVYFFDSLGIAPASNPTASGKVSGPVPEPASLLLLGSGLLGLAAFGRARKRKI